MNSAFAAVAAAMEDALTVPSGPVPANCPSWSLRVAAAVIPVVARLYTIWPRSPVRESDFDSGTGKGEPGAKAPTSPQAPTTPPTTAMTKAPRILILRRNRMGDMLCAYPLVRAIRLAHPGAVIHIACDQAALHAARACPHADAAILLKPGWHRWHMALRNAGQLQGYDISIAVKGGFDLVLASLLRLSNAPMRIGFQPKTEDVPARDLCKYVSAFYTHALPPSPWGEHQIETCLRLASPLFTSTTSTVTAPDSADSSSPGISMAASDIRAAIRDCTPHITPEHRAWAGAAVRNLLPSTSSASSETASASTAPSAASPVERLPLALINISSTAPLKWSDTQFQQLAERLTRDLGLAVAFVFAPADHARAAAMEKAIRLQLQLQISVLPAPLPAPRIGCAATPTPLHLAALLQHAAFLFSPEGGAGHLASFTGTPLLLLWSEGPFEKWHPRAEKIHIFRADLAHPQPVTIDEVMAVIENKNFLPPQHMPHQQREQRNADLLAPDGDADVPTLPLSVDAAAVATLGEEVRP